MRPCKSISQQAALAALTALSIYATATVLIFAPDHFFFRHSYLGGHGDPQQYMWFLSWWPYAISHRLNPLVTHLVWAPAGINLSWAVCMPSLALLAWPITALWGPVVSFNVLTISALVSGAFAAFMLCYELTDKCIPSLFGGWLYGFSSYEMGQVIGHLTLDFTACIPILVWLAVLRYKDKISTRKFVVTQSLVLVFQFGTSTELFATASLFGFIAVSLSYLLGAADRQRLIRMTTEQTRAYLLCFVVVSPYLYYMVKEWPSLPALLHPSNVYVADVANYLVPTAITALSGPWSAAISKMFSGNDLENGAYLGFPLLTIIVVFAATRWRARWPQVLLLMWFILVLCSTGPYIHFKGRSLWPMPWWLAEKLPLLHYVLPVRFSCYVSLVTGIMVAFWLTALRKRASMIGYLLAVLAVLTLLPNVRGERAYWFTDLKDLDIPAFFSDGDYKQALNPGDNVVVLPYGVFADSMMWQATSDMYFRMAGGYVTAYIPPSFARWPVVQMFYAGSPGPGFEDSLAAFCAANEVRAVIVARGTRKEFELALANMGWKRLELGGVVIYRVPKV